MEGSRGGICESRVKHFRKKKEKKSALQSWESQKEDSLLHATNTFSFSKKYFLHNKVAKKVH